MHSRFGIERFLAGKLTDRFETLLITRIVLEELIGFTRTKLSGLLGKAIAERLRELLQHRLEGSQRAQAELYRQYPDYARSLEERFLQQAALRMEEAEYRMLLSESVIGPEIYQDLQRSLRDGWRTVAGRPELDLGLETAALVGRFPMFDVLSETRLRQVVRLLRSRLVYPGERIVTAGERGNAMYFISSGAVEVDRDGNRFTLGAGDFFGELAMLANRRRTANVTAVGFCRLLVLSSRDFRRFVRSDSDLRARIREIAEQRLTAVGQAVSADRARDLSQAAD